MSNIYATARLPDQALLSLLLPLAVAVYAYRRARAMAPTGSRPTVTYKSFLLGCGLGFVAVIVIIRAFVFDAYSIPSTSMTPTLVPGDRILVAMWRPQVERGDVIVFDYPLDRAVRHVARVIGVPGDQLVIKDSHVTVNGTPAILQQKGSDFEETIGGKTWSIRIDAEKRVQPQAGADCKVYADNAQHCVVPAGHYFMMGDDRENANDSRSWGMLKQQDVVGKLVRTFH